MFEVSESEKEAQENPERTAVKLSSTGENPDIPDMNDAAQKNHAKHLRPGKSYPHMPMIDYVKKASRLARSAVGGDIQGYGGADNCIVRYNKTTNDWVKAYATGVASMFKPKRGADYYTENMAEDGGAEDD
jgi:hypothetical protein